MMQAGSKGHRRSVNWGEAFFNWLNTGDIPCFDAVVLCVFFWGGGFLLVLSTYLIPLFSQYQNDRAQQTVHQWQPAYSAEYVRSSFGSPTGVAPDESTSQPPLQAQAGEANAAASF